MVTANDEQSEFWQELAPNWLASTDHTELVAGPFGVAAMDCLHVGAGQRVLDVGCGDGATTLELARRVGPEGEAVGVDIAPAMLVAARERAAAQGVENASFVAADAQTESLGSSRFDGVFSRFGVMFFADPWPRSPTSEQACAMAESSRLRVGTTSSRTNGCSCPDRPSCRSPGHHHRCLAPDAPGPFSLADPDRVTAVLADAGFANVTVTTTRAPGGPSRGRRSSRSSRSPNGSEPCARRCATADADTAARIVDAVRATLTARVEGGQLRLSAAAHIVQAER